VQKAYRKYVKRQHRRAQKRSLASGLNKFAEPAEPYEIWRDPQAAVRNPVSFLF
jgi:hypothetical protein